MIRFLLNCLHCGMMLTLLVGCGEPATKLYQVSGTVTLDGQPLAEGTVDFKTIATGQIESLPVREGRFGGQALAGERRVEVNAYRLIPVLGEMGGEVQESLIASRYNAQSKLQATITPEGPNEFKFEVTSK